MHTQNLSCIKQSYITITFQRAPVVELIHWQATEKMSECPQGKTYISLQVEFIHFRNLVGQSPELYIWNLASHLQLVDPDPVYTEKIQQIRIKLYWRYMSSCKLCVNQPSNRQSNDQLQGCNHSDMQMLFTQMLQMKCAKGFC